MKALDIDQVRAFNRYYTRVLGLLDRHLLDSKFTLPEVRVMFEIYHHKHITSTELKDLLAMDKGYLSRMLLKFEKKGLVRKKNSESDGRMQQLFLSDKGEKEFLVVNRLSQNQIAELLAGLSSQDVTRLVGYMLGIKGILAKVTP